MTTGDKEPPERYGQALSAALIASVGAFLFGLDIGYIAPILECASFKRDVAHIPNWADKNSRIAAGTTGFMVGIFSIGCIVASFPVVSSYFLDVWGRRNSITIGSLVFLVGCLLQANAHSIGLMYAGRAVTGCSIGLLSTVVPLYQAEMSPCSMRGALTALYQFMITLGIFVAAALDQLLVDHDGGWRVVIWMQLIPGCLILTAMPFLPRSPRWLVQQGRVDEARQTLDSLRGDYHGALELKEITREVDEMQKIGDPRWSELFVGRVGLLVLVGASLQLLQQLVGMNAFMYFGPRIFGSLGLSPNKFQTINNAVNCVSTLPALYLADRAGRRSLLIVGALGMSLACGIMGVLGLIFIEYRDGRFELENGSVGVLLAICVFFFVMSFACSWGPIVWTYCSEIFPLKYRARCVGVTTTMNWVGNYIIAQFAPMLLDSVGFSTFFIFMAFSLISLGVAWWLPETKGLMLEHVGQLFDDKFGYTLPAKAAARPAGAKGAVSYGTVQ